MMSRNGNGNGNGTTVKRKNWTVMVYLSGDNDLSEECVWSLKEMYRATVSPSVGLVVQIDPKGSGPLRFDVGRFFEKNASKNSSQAKSQAGQTRSLQAEVAVLGGKDGVLFGRGNRLPRLSVSGHRTSHRRRPGGERDDMASPEMLRRFVLDCRNTHPADHYMLILSGHGGTALGHSFLLDRFPPRAMSMSDVTKAIKNTRGKEDPIGKMIDIIGMDSCGMGMAEVGYELRGCADYFVASEGFEQNTGWPYHKVLEILNNATPELEPRAIASQIVEAHTNYYADFLMAGISTDIAACDLKKSEKLVAEVKRLAEILKDALPDNTGEVYNKYGEGLEPQQRMTSDAIILAHWRAQSYGFERQTDLSDFCDLLQKGTEDPVVNKACNDVITAITGKKLDDGTNDGYVIKSLHTGGSFQYSNGVAVYFPWAEFFNAYNRLAFSNDTCWGEFVKVYVQRTRRCPRPGARPLISMPRADDSFDVKNFPEAGVKNFPEAGIKFGNGLVPQVKNPPDVFLKSDTPELRTENAARVSRGKAGRYGSQN